MILCHSPFRQKVFLEKYAERYVLVSGIGKMIEVGEAYGYRKIIDIEEYFSLYPQLAPVTWKHKS
jgi:hypothetical protein